jgi:hypothetical protein
MFEKLDDFSKEVASQVLERFPEWQSLAGTEHDGEECAFVLRVPAPDGDVEHPLSIDTFRQEVTVAFDAYHAHFMEFEDAAGDGAYDFVRRLIADEVAVVSYWRDAQWCGSTLLGIHNVPVDNEDYPYANTIRVRSWSGLYNKDIVCKPRN